MRLDYNASSMNQAQFATGIRALVARYGEKLIEQKAADMEAFRKELAPFAKHAKLSADQLARVVCKRYAEGGY